MEGGDIMHGDEFNIVLIGMMCFGFSLTVTLYYCGVLVIEWIEKKWKRYKRRKKYERRDKQCSRLYQ